MKEDRGGLIWPDLIRGVLLKRYKRFLADVRLDDGGVVTAHCANTGSMRACSEPGRPVFLSRRDDPKRKLKYTWEIIDMPSSRVGVDTGVPNRLVKAAAKAGKIAPLAEYRDVRSEVKIGPGVRLDLLLEGSGLPPCFIEIKNCTLVEKGEACFPDAITERGRKHLLELARLVDAGRRGVIFFLIQRMDAEVFRPADRIDPEYGLVLRRVAAAGVELMAYDVDISLDRIDLRKPVVIKL
ncbi:MAG: DNA/RNA nuclease SfsA [Pseudomonadota bacterium]